jgi:hypothetical protein
MTPSLCAGLTGLSDCHPIIRFREAGGKRGGPVIF